jgi:hypothetical protein
MISAVNGRSGLIAWKEIKKKFADVKCQIELAEEVGYHWPDQGNHRR